MLNIILWELKSLCDTGILDKRQSTDQCWNCQIHDNIIVAYTRVVCWAARLSNVIVTWCQWQVIVMPGFDLFLCWHISDDDIKQEREGWCYRLCYTQLAQQTCVVSVSYFSYTLYWCWLLLTPCAINTSIWHTFFLIRRTSPTHNTAHQFCLSERRPAHSTQVMRVARRVVMIRSLNNG